MTINTGPGDPASGPGGTGQETREARRRQRVLTLVMAGAVVRAALSRRALAGVIVRGIGLAAMKRMGSERGTPALDWYRARGRNEKRGPA